MRRFGGGSSGSSRFRSTVLFDHGLKGWVDPTPQAVLQGRGDGPRLRTFVATLSEGRGDSPMGEWDSIYRQSPPKNGEKPSQNSDPVSAATGLDSEPSLRALRMVPWGTIRSSPATKVRSRGPLLRISVTNWLLARDEGSESRLVAAHGKTDVYRR